jgi:hypothetical protein
MGMKSSYLVAGLNPSEKYEFVSWDYYSQLNGKIKFMFQTPYRSPTGDFPTSIASLTFAFLRPFAFAFAAGAAGAEAAEGAVESAESVSWRRRSAARLSLGLQRLDQRRLKQRKEGFGHKKIGIF